MADKTISKDTNKSNQLVDDLTGFVSVRFGNTVISTKKNPDNAAENIPQYVQSFNFERVTNGLGNFTLVLVDDQWTVIEQLIQDNKGKLKIQYGMLSSTVTISDTTSEKTNKSPEINAQIYTFDLDMQLDYVVITIQGLCLGTGLLGNSVVGSNAIEKEAMVTGVLKSGLDARASFTISELVNNIAGALGYDPAHRNIDKTTNTWTKADLGTTEDLQQALTFDSATVLNVVVKSLIRKASSASDKKSPYVFYISTNDKGEEVFNFHRHTQSLEKPAKRVLTLFSDPTSHVKSFKPSFEHEVMNVFAGKSVVAYGYDPLTGTMMKIDYSVENGPSKQNPQEATERYKKASYQGGPREVNDVSLKAITAQMSVSPLTADLIMVGDATYNLMECIDVYVNIPTGPLKGKPHNTSSRFIILGILDSIRDGVYETVLKLGTGSGFTPLGQVLTNVAANNAAVEAKLAADNKKYADTSTK